MSRLSCQLEDVSVKDGGADVLGPLSLTFEATGLLLVMGPNGAGKSLLLRVMHGLTKPSAGRVLWNGAPAEETLKERGFVFQTPPLLRRSVRANVIFPLKALGRRCEPERIDNALTDARLLELADRPAALLSGGERQRMAVARALVCEPRVLLLDEPSASLDPASTKSLEEMILAAVQSGIGVVLSTHDPAQARRLGGQLIFLDAGRIVERQSTEAFLMRPLSVAGSNYLYGRI